MAVVTNSGIGDFRCEDFAQRAHVHRSIALISFAAQTLGDFVRMHLARFAKRDRTCE